MFTDATLQALDGLRDLGMIKWYVIPLLAIVLYIYAREIKEARKSGDWNAVFAGVTLFGADFLNETVNGWIMYLSERSALWTTPGDTALRVLVGWNIEIIFMFLIAGIIYYHSLSANPSRAEMWGWAVAFAAFCVFVECLLNMGGHLVWEYPFWKRTFGGVWLIFVFGYFAFFCWIILVITRKTIKARLAIVAGLYAVPAIMNILALGLWGWNY
ncbi:MAG: hypothetical protein ACOZBW_00930 [Thermodesulfobacteriota bacterium]